MAMTEQEFLKLSPKKQEETLGALRLEKDFEALPTEDQVKINSLLKADKAAPMDELEAGARGAAQGLTFGFADEIAAGLTAAGTSFIGKEEFRPEFEKALERQRGRDKLAQEKFPKLFTGTEIAGAVGTALIPMGAQLGIGARASRLVKPAKGFFDLTRGGITALSRIRRDSAIAKALGITSAELGKGVARGVTGVAKATLGGAALGLGKAEDKTKEAALEGALIGGVFGAGAAILGPAARAVGKLTIRSPEIVQAIATGGKSAAIRTVLQKVKGKLPAKEIAKGKIDALLKASSAPEGRLASGAEKFLDILGEALEKQGGSGLVAAHLSLLESPEYTDFLDKVEKQKGLTAPKGKK